MTGRSLKLVLRVEKKMFVIEQPIPPVADSEAQVLAEWNAVYDAHNEEGKPVGAYVFKMKGYVEQLERLGYVLPQDLSIGLILNGLTNDIVGFIRNYNMHNMGKTIGELHALLIEYEKGLPKKADTPQVMAIQGGRIQKANKKSQRQGMTPATTAKRWVIRRGIVLFILLSRLRRRSKLALPVLQGLRGVRKLKQGALYLYVGNDVRAQVEAIGSFDLVLPNGLVICLDNFSKNNVLYFNAIPRNGIYEIDMHNLMPNVNYIYNVINKRAKHNLDSTYLWNCCLAHISKKRIEKLQHDRLLKSTDDESFDQCVSCLSGKMTRKPFPHRTEMATDLLGLIHTDVCGPTRHVSRQGASYFIIFTDDYSRYGYVYLLKHKHEVFETFKVFKNEVENQLEKTIKALRSDRGGEYISQEFKDYLKACGIVQQLTPPYTPQHNGVSKRRNQVSGRAVEVKEIQDEDTSPSENTSKIPMKVEGFEPPQEEVIPVCRSVRIHRASDRLCLNVEVQERRLDAMNAEMQSMKDNQVCRLIDLPPNGKTIGSKWLFKKKTDMDGNVHTYKARLVAKGFTQTYGVDYEEMFSPVADIRAIRILIAITAFYDYEIWQMDVTTAFLNGYID
ncbi:retrotransposon protein, putative, ty1-copia subclass [Tanacetum coccineum]